MNLNSAVVFRKRYFLTPIVMNDRRRFSFAIVLGICFNLLLLAAGEFYLQYIKQDLHIEKETPSVIQVVLGKSTRENNSSTQTMQEEIILEEEQIVLPNQIADEALIPSQQTIDEVTEPIVDQDDVMIDSVENNVSASENLPEVFTDSNIISSSTNASETIADNNYSSHESSIDTVEAIKTIETVEAERNILIETIYALIEKEKTYPALARRRNIEGQVDMTIAVSMNGQLINSNISSRSDSSILDQAAINLVKNIFPLNINLQSETTITVTINYSLQ